MQKLANNVKTIEQIANSLIKDKIDKKGKAILAIGGKKVSFTLKRNHDTSNIQQLSIKSMIDIQSTLELSNTKILKLAKELRFKAQNRKIVQSGLAAELKRIDQQLDDCFVEDFELFNIKSVEEKSLFKLIPFIRTTDVNEFLWQIIDKKGAYPQNQYIKISIDGGRGFLKVCLNVVSNPSETIKNKRRKYGEIKSPSFKEGSVKASFIIALVPDVPETNHNVKILLNKLCLDKINFTCVADIKLCQVICGMSSSSMATHPCYICTWNRTEVFKNDCTELRTLGSLRLSSKLYKLSGSKKIRAKEYFNCIDEVLLIGDDNDLVVNHLSPPELHLMEGAPNHIFKTINKLADPVLLKKIENDLNISKSIRNGSYNGNGCRKILKN
ncbi:uncharacterized protein LOC124816992 [Hydra vulgaris]|uniref:uncharacterized protein LOC124816992 n=1 Tax=Hydra vulgaris TaxID=6087 RepID=UPI001F5F35F7|nr:uncharacterized protein LOC124816992 [Hydra vulgaris]